MEKKGAFRCHDEDYGEEEDWTKLIKVFLKKDCIRSLTVNYDDFLSESLQSLRNRLNLGKLKYFFKTS